jgi:hypothetical protein
VIDPVDRLFVERAEHDLVQLSRRARSLPKGFSTMTRPPWARPIVSVHHRAEQYRQNRQVMGRALGVLEFFTQGLKRRRVW